MSCRMRTVSVRIPKNLDDALNELARRRNASRCALVCQALEIYSTRCRRSVTAAVDDLVDALDGPSNLSTNPKGLRGFGK